MSAESVSSDAQIADLQAEIDRLHKELEARPTEPTHHLGWVRSTAVVVLMALGFLLTPVSIAAIWTRNEVFNTDVYVETITPLADDPAVINAVADAVTKAMFARIDVQQVLQQELPPQLAFAAGPIASTVESQTNGLVVKALETPQFQQAWISVNTAAHEALVKFLTGDTSAAVSVQNGQLVLDIGPIVSQVRQQLIDQGVSIASKIPDVSTSIVLPIANVDAIVKARQVASTFHTLSYVLPILGLLFFALAVYLARDRRRALIWVGFLLAAGAFMSGVALNLERSAYLSVSLLPQDAASSVFDTVMRFLKNANRVVFFVGILLAAVAAFSGPYGWAVKTRSVVGGAVTSGGEKTGLDTGAFGSWFAAHRRGWAVGIAVLYAIVVVVWTRPTPAVLFWLLVAALVLLAVFQFLAATAPRPDVEDEASDTAGKPPVDSSTHV
ncbi:MAG: hypothetical protein WAN48_10555 [Actinomycetes bacterium]